MPETLSIRITKRDALASAFLAVLAFVSFGPSLFAGFLSDDGQQYTYIYNYLHNQPLMLLQNFNSCWMQEPLWGLHYRPMMLLPLVFDVLVWNQNTVGWHITCLLIHASCTVLTFILARLLLKKLADSDGISIPFLAGALFAVHPLHAESVAWICGRVDSVCTFFYLFAFVLFLKSLEIESKHGRAARVLSLCSCAAALLSKEVGVTVPAVLLWYSFCSNLRVIPWTKASLSALKATRMYWLLLALYMLIRGLALGTFYGGYHGFGSVALDAIWLTGLLNWQLLRGVFVPISLPQMVELDSAFRALIGLYVAIVFASVLRFSVIRDWGVWRPILFLIGWLIMAFALVARVWYAAGGLPGGRHFYLVSVPLCILFALLVVPTSMKNAAEKKLQKFSIGILAVYSLLLSSLSFKSSELWIHANRNEVSIEKGIAAFAEKNPTAKRLLFLNASATYEHLPLYPTFVNLRGCLMPPLFQKDLNEKIATLKAHIFNLDLVNKSALLANLQEPDTIAFGFDGDKKEICPIPSDYFSDGGLSGSVFSTEVTLQPVTKVPSVTVYSLTPAQSMKRGLIDCLEITASCVAGTSMDGIEPSMLLSWTRDTEGRKCGILNAYKTPEGARSLWRVDDTDGLASSLTCFMEADGKPHKYRFHLSEISSWILFGKISDLQLTVSPPNTEIVSVRFLNLENEIPKLYAPRDKWIRLQNGTLAPKSSESLILNFDATKIREANHVMAEISKPFEYYEYFNSTYRQDVLSPNSLKKYSLEGLKGEMELWREDFKIPGEYDVRVAAFDKSGRMIGYVSDPVTISIK